MVGLAAATSKFKAFTNAYQINIINYGSLALDSTLGRKILKRHFFQDVNNSFHGVTQIGLKPQYLERLHIYCHLAEIAQDIDLKFSAFAYHMSGLN